MQNSAEYVLVIGAFQGFLLFLLLSFDSRMSTASRVLGLLCLMMASVLAMPLVLTGRLPLPAWTAGWLFYLPATGGSLAYLYCRSALLGRALSARDLLLLLPWLACYALAADRLFGNTAELNRWIQGAPDPGWRLQASEYLVFIQAFTFAAATLRMISRYRGQARDTLADFDPRIFRWMLVLQVFTLGIWTFKALPALSSAPVLFAHLADLMLVVVIYLIAITQWRQPEFFRIRRLADEQDAQSREAVPQVGDEANGELDSTTRAQLYELLRRTVEGEKLYLDSGLTLTSLAEATGLSRHQVSEALNRHGGKNFYEFINGYRVEAVVRAIEDGSRQPVLSIAMDAGFSSKSTFNAIFKQFMGMTPTAYRRAKQEQGETEATGPKAASR